MTKTKIMLAVTMIAVAVFVWQQLHIWRLEKERADLLNQTALADSPDRDTRPDRAQIDPAELARLRADQSELLRLRNEVSQLRRQVKAAAAKPTPLPNPPGANPQDEIPDPPVEIFVASNHVTLAWKQTLVTGGWSTAPGKRTLFFLQPEPIASTNHPDPDILIKAKVIEIPDELLSNFGLDSMRSESQAGNPQTVFTPYYTEDLLKQLEKTQGVNFVSSPRIQTRSDVEASLSVGGALSLPNGETHQLGTLLRVLPQVSPDYSSVVLTVSSQFRKPKR